MENQLVVVFLNMKANFLRQLFSDQLIEHVKDIPLYSIETNGELRSASQLAVQRNI